MGNKRKKTDKLHFIKVCGPNTVIKKLKRQPAEGQRISENDKPDTGLIAILYKELLKPNKINNPIKNGQRTEIDISPEKISKYMKICAQ